jgi:hypothetical protein
MAKKVRVQDFPSRRYRYASAITTFPVEVSVSREPQRPHKSAFRACAYIAKRGSRRRDLQQRNACSNGSSPRRAAGRALKALGTTVLTRRTSAFAGMK